MILPPNLNLLNLNIEDSFYLALPSFFGSAFFLFHVKQSLGLPELY